MHLIVLIFFTLFHYNSGENFCYSPGRSCSHDCSSIVTCSQDHEGIFKPSITTNCSIFGLQCNPKTKDCSQPFGLCPSCSTQRLTCPNPTSLPNPNPCDCQKYYICMGGGIIMQNCEKGYIFDPLTNSCSLKYDPAICNAVLPPRCQKPGQTAMYPRSSNKYFVCSQTPTGELVHNLYECLYNQRWDPILGRCVDIPLSSTPPPNGEFQCPTQGKFPDENNCRAYYDCNRSLVATRKKCWPLNYFNAKRQRCMLGFC